MVTHAAFGGSTNLLLHVPAIAHAAGLTRPGIADWMAVNRAVPRLVDALPAGPHPTVRVHLAGGVPEVLLHLRALGLLETQRADLHRRDARRGARLVGAERTPPALPPGAARSGRRRSRCRHPAAHGGRRGRADQHRVLHARHLAPEGAIVKSTAIARDLLGDDGVYRHVGPARVFTSEADAIRAIKGQDETALQPGEVVVVAGIGPMGTGMEEVYQVTSALKHLPRAARHAAAHRRAVLGRLHRAVRRTHRPGGPGRRAARPPARRRPRARRDRHARRWPAASTSCARTRRRANSCPMPRRWRAGRRIRRWRRIRSCRRDAALGGAAGRQRRHVGRLRLRCRRDYSETGQRLQSCSRADLVRRSADAVPDGDRSEETPHA